jgi:hypothetical protein
MSSRSVLPIGDGLLRFAARNRVSGARHQTCGRPARAGLTASTVAVAATIGRDRTRQHAAPKVIGEAFGMTTAVLGRPDHVRCIAAPILRFAAEMPGAGS